MESRGLEEWRGRWGGREDEGRCWDRGSTQQNRWKDQHWESGKKQDERRDPSQKPGQEQGREEVVEVEVAVEEQEGRQGDQQQEPGSDNSGQR
jgi:hypothetical protein